MRWVALASMMFAACGNRGNAPDAAAPSHTALLDEGKNALEDGAATHDSLVKISDRLGARATMEGGTASGVLLATTAGELRIRAFRLSGGTLEEDARRAMDWLGVATGRADLAEACRPARLRAELSGELAHDPRTTYRELYVAQRRFGKVCEGELDAAMAGAGIFRPSPAVLEELDRALAAEGVVGLDAAAPAKPGKPRVVRVSRWTTNDSARVVVELDRASSYVLEPASSGTVRLRLEGVDMAGSDASIEPGKGLLLGGSLAPIADSKTGAGTIQEGGTAVILSLAKPAYRRVFFLPDPFRVVIDLTTTPPVAQAGSGPRPLRRLVIDAGHGGSDPGAIGPTGLREKDVTLALAKAVAPIVAKELGAEVRLTRASDTFVSLEERAASSNAFEADVFLSIHCNAAEAKGRRGIETYVLDTARDELATRVAARENGGGSSSPGELRAILDDLKLAELGTRSHHLATLIQRATMASLHTGEKGDFGDVVDGGVHGAGFFVLVGARMPAVLMEVSFISNPVEEGYLSRADYRSRITDAIVNALRAYKDGK
ncbi:MAG: N-acetylmuramoyl-L-alanine amidase family protein [Polyangiales bacterium]